MVAGNAGKGDSYRPVDRKKYDANWLRIFGKVCWNCKGKGEFVINEGQVHTQCKRCKGTGKML